MGAFEYLGDKAIDVIDEETFFPPMQFDLIDSLLAEFEKEKAVIERLSGLFANDTAYVNALRYFSEGNLGDRSGYCGVDNLFKLDGALLSLTATYWSKALALTNVMEYMPQARRDKWYDQLNGWKQPRYKKGDNPEKDLPDFNESTVRATLGFLLNSRAEFFAEKIDGLFKSLSGHHVTNAPEGFGKRMIIQYIHNGYTSDFRRCGYIADLRAVIAKFMGREGTPTQYDTGKIVDNCMENFGQWHVLDGGTLRLRVYKVGTAHLEICEAMSLRLNGVLASIYPQAIPPKFRQKQSKKTKEFSPLCTPLPFDVLTLLADFRIDRNNQVTLPSGYTSQPSEAHQKAGSVLEGLGGVRAEKNHAVFAFDYNPKKSIQAVLMSGCVPDDKSHQYYPTPTEVAQQAVAMADIDDTHTILEPSAGLGGIADLLPKAQTVCVELSQVRCAALTAKGFTTHCVDFLAWAKKPNPQTFERVVMNPPFSEGRAMLHVQAAAELVQSSGILVAILPASYAQKTILPGWAHEWSDTIVSAFDNTSINVVILKAVRP